MTDHVTQRPVISTRPGSNNPRASIEIEDRATGQVMTIARDVPWYVAHNIRHQLDAIFSLAMEAQGRS